MDWVRLKSSVGLLVLIVCLVATEGEECVQGENCNLPHCFCATFKHPMGANNIPQIVYFGFDDAVTPEEAVYFDQLFTKERLNPNGCPITMSLYVSDQDTKYWLVKNYFDAQNEIGVHSVTHTYIKTAEKLKQEAMSQKKNLERGAEIPPDYIIGWRSPDLITAGDHQPQVLKELNYTYDISLPYEADKRVPFPFTLDFGYPYTCSMVPCPRKDHKHEGFWEVPINNLYDPVKNIACTYVDGCRPESEEEAYEFLMYNFNRSYREERSPFGLNMHAAWFFFPKYMRATYRFIQTLTTDYPDMYIISVQQMMAWMMHPKNIEESKSFEPWSCPQKKFGSHNVPKAASMRSKILGGAERNLHSVVAENIKSRTHRNKQIKKSNFLSLIFRSMKESN